MDLGLAGRSVIVTGSSGGIGRAIALAFARERARVAITYRHKREAAERVAESVAAAGGEALVVPFALEDTATAVALVESVRTHWGELHVLVNNAVAWPAATRTVAESTLDDFTQPVHANIDGTFALIHAALPLLHAAEWARVVTISTGLSVDGFPGSAAYATGKAALHGLHRTLAKEVGADGILVNIVMAGMVDVETRARPARVLEQAARAAVTGRLTTAEDVARAAVFFGSLGNGHITGEAVRCDGFYVTGARRES